MRSGIRLLPMLPLLVALLPILAINGSLLLAIGAGVIAPCFPYVDGCASISATGRYEPGSFLFKPAMMSEWTLMVLYWLLNVAWLRALASAAGQGRKPGLWIGVIGSGGALALILYVTFLGSQVPFYELMRRFGIYLYFLFTVVAQILLARNTIVLSKLLRLPVVERIGKLQLFLAVVPFALGALNVVLKATLADPDPAENVIEWNFALLMHIYFLLTYVVWRHTGFDSRLSIDLPARHQDDAR